MKRTYKAIVSVLAVLVAVALAEEFRSPVLFKSDVDFDTGSNLKISGTKVTATAAQINAASGGATATVTPTTATVSNLLTISKTLVQTPETLTLTNGSFVLTPTQSVYFVAGQYGVITMNLGSATYSGMPLEIANLVATNVVIEDTTANIVTFPTGYSTWTNGQYRGMRFRSQSTNWICTGTF